jgi:hypothetical protein
MSDLTEVYAMGFGLVVFISRGEKLLNNKKKMGNIL